MARDGRARRPDRRQDGQRRRAAGAEKAHRPAGDRPRASAGAAGAAAGRAGGLRLAAAVDHGLHRAARIPVRARHPARGAHHRPASVPPPARLVAALSPEPPDRRHDARYRTRHARREFADLVLALQRAADPGRDHAGAGLPGAQLRQVVFDHHRRRPGHLHRLHGRGHRMAHPFPAHDERARLESQYQGDRLADQLRNGEILRQRRLRSQALRPGPAELRECRGALADLAVGAQYRAVADHRHRRHADPVARHRRA